MWKRRAGPLALVALALWTSACDGIRLPSQSWNGFRIDPPVAKPDVRWERSDGRPYDVVHETAGVVTLLYFGYTHCPDVCPMQLMHLATALRRFGADTASRFRVLVVTLDPARDTAKVLDDWVHGFHPDFIALRGAPTSVATEVARLRLQPELGANGDPASPDPAHAAAVIAFARDGLGHFLYPASTNPEAWAYDLRKMLRDSVP